MQYLGFLLLQTAAAPSAQTNPLMSFLPLVFIVAIFYFLVFMPMQKQKKQQAQMLSSLQTGTDVLTTGGIVGTIISITDTTMVLRVKPDNIKLQVMRSAVASLVDTTKPAIEEKK
jgi:preprotein translocase subunit YajC